MGSYCEREEVLEAGVPLSVCVGGSLHVFTSREIKVCDCGLLVIICGVKPGEDSSGSGH